MCDRYDNFRNNQTRLVNFLQNTVVVWYCLHILRLPLTVCLAYFDLFFGFSKFPRWQSNFSGLWFPTSGSRSHCESVFGAWKGAIWSWRYLNSLQNRERFGATPRFREKHILDLYLLKGVIIWVVGGPPRYIFGSSRKAQGDETGYERLNLTQPWNLLIFSFKFCKEYMGVEPKIGFSITIPWSFIGISIINTKNRL